MNPGKPARFGLALLMLGLAGLLHADVVVPSIFGDHMAVSYTHLTLPTIYSV